MMKLHSLVLFMLCMYSVRGDTVISIGAVLSSSEYGQEFQKALQDINNDPKRHPAGVHFNATYILMNNNPIQAAKSVCDILIPTQVHVVIASHPDDNPLSPVAVSFTCGYYHIPVIGISARDSAFSDKNIHGSFMRTVAPYADQTKVWARLLDHWQFRSVVMIHSSDAEGRAMLGGIQGAAESSKHLQIARTIQYPAGERNYTDILQVIPNYKQRVILLYANKEDAETIFENAASLGITDEGYAWIVTEQALEAKNAPIGILGLVQLGSTEEKKHIRDAVSVIAKAFMNLAKDKEAEKQAGGGRGVTQLLTEAPNKCSEEEWEDGDLLLEYLKQVKISRGETGQLEFNNAGDRKSVQYEIINIHSDGPVQIGCFPCLDDDLQLEFPASSATIWPKVEIGTEKKPAGIKIDTFLKVVTVEALPFVYTHRLPEGATCDRNINRVKCPRKNSTAGTQENFCCDGYAIDLLLELNKNLSFEFELHLVEDGRYGSEEFVTRNGETKAEWDGLIGEVLNGEADMIVAPLTVNPERARVIDFSKPFKYQGLTVLVKKTVKDSSLASFLQPFHDTLWILVGLSVHVVALVLYLLDRFSPFGRYKLAKSDDTEEDALNLSGAVWFAWGVLLNSGIGEGTPRSFSARVLGMVWAGFAMIIVASYTANLAAFLVLDRPDAPISGIDDARLRNPQASFQYATVKNSAVAMYFKRQVELSTMYRTMELINVDTAEDAIDKVRNGKLQAFIWDSSRLEFEAANDCDLETAGELFGRSGYGVGMAKNSPWTQMISMAILQLHESGKMEALDSRWILIEDTKCPDQDPSAATLGLTNMAGVFMMVAGGIVMGVFLIFIEIAYKRHRGLKEKELELAKTAADRWRGNIEKRRTLRRTLLQQQVERNRLTNGDPSPPGKNPAAPTATTSATGPPGHPQPGTTQTSGIPTYLPPVVMTQPDTIHSQPPRSRPGGYQAVATDVMTPRSSPSPSKSGSAGALGRVEMRV